MKLFYGIGITALVGGAEEALAAAGIVAASALAGGVVYRAEAGAVAGALAGGTILSSLAGMSAAIHGTQGAAAVVIGPGALAAAEATKTVVDCLIGYLRS